MGANRNILSEAELIKVSFSAFYFLDSGSFGLTDKYFQ
ncbi:hypothetical protein RSOCI_02195 [Rhabdochlamydiaceae symbiont of Dictyostelium giganteum]